MMVSMSMEEETRIMKKNDLHFYSRQTNSWAEIVPNGSVPARQAPTAVWSNQADGFYVFGGCCWENDLHFYSRESNSWEKLSPAGTLPLGREGGESVWGDAADGFYVCGGYQSNFGIIIDLAFYSRASNAWQRLWPTGSPPDARYHHTLVWSEIDDGFYLFGGYANVAEDDGYGGWGTFQRNDLYLYSRQANSWQKLEPNHDHDNNVHIIDADNQYFYLLNVYLDYHDKYDHDKLDDNIDKFNIYCHDVDPHIIHHHVDDSNNNGDIHLDVDQCARRSRIRISFRCDARLRFFFVVTMLMKNATEHLKSADLFTPQAEMRVFLLKSLYWAASGQVAITEKLILQFKADVVQDTRLGAQVAAAWLWDKRANAVKEAQKERAAAAREQKKSPQGASFSSQRNDHVFFGPHRNHWRKELIKKGASTKLLSPIGGDLFTSATGEAMNFSVNELGAVLIETYGLDVNHQDENGQTCGTMSGTMSQMKSVMRIGITGETISACHLQLSLAPVPLPRDAEKKGSVALEGAEVGQQRPKQAVKLLIGGHNANPNQAERAMLYLVGLGNLGHPVSPSGQTLLHQAAQNEQHALEVAKVLIHFKVDAEKTDIYGQTAIFYAARDGNAELCEFLLQHGCAVNHVDTNRQTPIFYSVRNGHGFGVESWNLDLRFWGVELVFTKMAATNVFLKRGADVEIKDECGFTPIFWAAESGRVDTMRLN
ncbi:unnamed protein product [Cladocopium goreaui]|uniref:Ankycorbin (Ankyrin repeat and coiled-coil structure-containing protein) (Retinoic acid-induced protein 14) n=1 Tax=Cladocopium goreaui TaxID=2562237 RepID=A0A9P1DGW2_9DINO|nr:unnamed protein product [Cladocopium goreaui]